jgi:hypothetical protein
MSSWIWKTGLASAAIVSATAYAVAQMPSGHSEMHGQMGEANDNQQHMMTPGGMPDAAMHEEMMRQMHARMGGDQSRHGGMGHQGMGGTLSREPTMPGQDAFGAIAEIVRTLQADPSTDWSKVNIDAVREHLIDMNEVTLHAVASQRPLDNGVEIAVTGEGRTLDAIERMVPANATELSKIGWNAKTEDLPNGVKLTVTSPDPKQVTMLKALGFMGIMVQGGHHQPHHLMMAKGEMHVH